MVVIYSCYRNVIIVENKSYLIVGVFVFISRLQDLGAGYYKTKWKPIGSYELNFILISFDASNDKTLLKS